MKIILIPIGGLANRMRVVDSVANLRNEGADAVVLWRKDWRLGVRFDHIFKPVGFVHDIEQFPLSVRFVLKVGRNKRLQFFRWLLEKLHILLYLSEEQMDEQRSFARQHNRQHYLYVVMRSWEYFYAKEQFHAECFILKDNPVFESLKEKINSHTVGVHIRRTDHKWSIENSPLELFEREMAHQMELDPLTNFLVCSDNEEIKSHFKNSATWAKKVFTPSGDLSRGSESGILQAVGEMYALSLTRLILAQV